jgi:transcription initiation factor IIE alpha subunit
MYTGESNWRGFFEYLFDMPYNEILNTYYPIMKAEFKEGTKISNIYKFFKEKPNKKYTSNDIAQITGFSKKRTSSILLKLQNNGLIRHIGYKNIYKGRLKIYQFNHS